MVRKDGQQKNYATCLATLLQNELNSDVARLTTHIKPVLQRIRLLTGLNMGGKTRNIAIQIQIFAAMLPRQVARFLLPVFPYLK